MNPHQQDSDGCFPFAHVDLEDQRGLSAFGLVLQIQRLNLMVPGDLHSSLGVTARYSDDLSYRLATSQPAQRAILARIPLPESVSGTWGIGPWQPYSGSLLAHAGWGLRGCPICFRFGFHSNLFQMPWISKCPWHRVPLSDTCQSCRRPWGKTIERDTPLLLCPCGGDAVDQPALLEWRHPFRTARNHFVVRYLQWASASRKTSTLFGNDDGRPELQAALARMIRLPRSLSQRVQPPDAAKTGWHEQCIRVTDEQRGRSGPVDDDLRRSCQSFRTADPSMVEIPSEARTAAIEVTRAWGERCPKGTLSIVGEGFDSAKAASEVEPPPRSALVLIPPYAGASRTRFDGRVLARDVYQVLTELCDNYLTYGTSPVGEGASAPLIRRILATVLARGYADALARSLTRYGPPLSALVRRPGATWHPVILCGHSRRATWARISWIPRNSG